MLYTEKIFSRVFLSVICTLSIWAVPVTASSVVNQSAYRYVINIDSLYKKPIKNIRQLKKKYHVYQIKVRIKGKVKYRTRIGFFKSRKKANVILKRIRRKNKSAWLDTVRKYDKQQRLSWHRKINLSQPKNLSRKSFQLSKKETHRLMEKARVSSSNQDIQQSIVAWHWR